MRFTSLRSALFFRAIEYNPKTTEWPQEQGRRAGPPYMLGEGLGGLKDRAATEELTERSPAASARG